MSEESTQPLAQTESQTMSPLDLVRAVLTEAHKHFTNEANLLNEQLNQMEKAGQQTLTKSYSLDKLFDSAATASDILNSIPNQTSNDPQTWAEYLKFLDTPDNRQREGELGQAMLMAGNNWKEKVGYQYHSYYDGLGLVVTNSESVLLHDNPEDREQVRISKREYEEKQRQEEMEE